MKIKAALLFQCISLVAGAQTLEERIQIRQTYEEGKLLLLKQKNEEIYSEQQVKIRTYLERNPDKKKQFQKNGKLYFLHHINADGIPVYLTTKDVQ